VIGRRVVSLDFLRGMAALSVTIPHFFMFQHIRERVAESISILGVEVFFILSGYVLAPQIMFFVIEQPNARNYPIFLIRRWMRTVPPYLIALTLISTAHHELLTADFLRYAVYAQNFYRQSNTSDYFSIAWSLSVEEWFYLLFPPVLITVVIITRRSVVWAVLGGIAFVALISALREIFADYTQWGPDVRRVVIFRMDAIAWGFLLNLAITRSSAIKAISPMAAVIGFVAMLSASVFLTINIANTPNTITERVFPYYAAAFGASAILLAIKAEPIFDKHLRLAAIGSYLGRTSYSVYLFHLFVLDTVGSTLSWLPWPVLLLVYLSATIAVASLMFTAVESPILSARPEFAIAHMN
jgi:peptidoglycan/LPS O-acetylase OafA/YrhL